jgi:hypothetical protein
VAADGGIFSFGDAVFYGSMGGSPLNQPVVGIASSNDGGGYWEVAADGGIFSFGDAPFEGSLGGVHLNQPIVGMAGSVGSPGYWLVAADGGVFGFGGAHFYGSLGGTALGYPVVALTPTPDGGGYWLLGTTAISKSLGRMMLPPAPTPSTVGICAASLSYGEDGTFSPLTCDNGTEVNAVAWEAMTTIAPAMLSLGPVTTPSAVLTAYCRPGGPTTIPLSMEAYMLASTYYSWPFTVPQQTFVNSGCE